MSWQYCQKVQQECDSKKYSSESYQKTAEFSETKSNHIGHQEIRATPESDIFCDIKYYLLDEQRISFSYFCYISTYIEKTKVSPNASAKGLNCSHLLKPFCIFVVVISQ